jgi:TRAP-type mannitol/chloroaromatic compound transport system permease large subunit
MITLTYRYQLMGAVWALLGTALVIMPINLGIAFRQLGLSAIRFFAIVYRPLLASIPMYFIVRELLTRTMMNVTGFASLGLLLGAIATGAVIYVVSILVLWRMTGRPLGPENTIITQVKNKLQT